MSGHPYYDQALHGPYETHGPGDFELEDGGVLPGAFLAYSRFGTFAEARDNAILVTTWFSGTSKIMEQAYIGAGRALDPGKYFIVVVNQIGSGLSSSPHNHALGRCAEPEEVAGLVTFLCSGDAAQITGSLHLVDERCTARQAQRRARVGGPEWIRTIGLCLRRAALYPAELRVPHWLNSAL